MVSETNKKITEALFKKLDSLVAKHGIKLVGGYTDFPKHIVYNIYDTPNMEAFFELTMEPEMMAWYRFNVVETKSVMGIPEVKAMLKIK